MESSSVYIVNIYVNPWIFPCATERGCIINCHLSSAMQMGYAVSKPLSPAMQMGYAVTSPLVYCSTDGMFRN